MLKITLTVLFIGIAVVPNVSSWSCRQKITRKGCFKQYRTPFSKLELLFNDRRNIDWGDYRGYLILLLCNCAEAAEKKNYKYFSIRYYGECMGGNLEDIAVEAAGADKKSTTCVNQEYKACGKFGLLCAGGGMTDSLFTQEPLYDSVPLRHPETTPKPTKKKPMTFTRTVPMKMRFPLIMTFPPIPGGFGGDNSKFVFPPPQKGLITFPPIPPQQDEKNEDEKKSS